MRKVFQRDHRTGSPLDLNILKRLKRSPLGLDLYLWLTYRTFTLKTPLTLAWRQLYRQFGADPAKANETNAVNVLLSKLDLTVPQHGRVRPRHVPPKLMLIGHKGTNPREA